MNTSVLKLVAAASLQLAVLTSHASADTLDEVKERGFVRCGTSDSKTGFAAPGDDNEWHGMEIDYCKGLAAAIFGDASKLEIVPVASKVRFTSLTSGEIDILAKGTTWTFSRDAKLGVDFAGYWFFDGQGFLVTKELGVESAKELDGAVVCISPGTTSEKNIADYFRTNNMEFTPFVINAGNETQEALSQGRCDVVTNDISALASSRVRFKNPDDYIVLPENIAQEPLSLYVRQNDSRWNDIVTWVRNAFVKAEELKITQDNVFEMVEAPDDPRVERLLGVSGEFGDMLGLSNDWIVQAISAVGNYGEIFERHVGKDTLVALDRGQNRQWYDEGLLYSPPFR